MRNSKMDESVKFGCHFREIWVIVPSPLLFVLWFWRRRARFHHPSFSSSSSALLFFLLFTMSLMMAVNRASIEVNDDRENAVTALGSIQLMRNKTEPQPGNIVVVSKEGSTQSGSFFFWQRSKCHREQGSSYRAAVTIINAARKSVPFCTLLLSVGTRPNFRGKLVKWRRESQLANGPPLLIFFSWRASRSSQFYWGPNHSVKQVGTLWSKL